MQAAVIGAGSWGTVLAALLAGQGVEVRLWARDPELAADIARHHANRRYLPDLPLPTNLRATGDLAEALAGQPFVLVVVPSVGVPAVAAAVAAHLAPGAVVISATKGLEHDTGRRMSVVLTEAFGGRHSVAVLSGPNLSHEIAAGLPSATVLAGAEDALLQPLWERLSSPRFRVYRNDDTAGVELGGALKNPLAIAAGICDGLGLGDNAKAALMTRGMHEIRRLGVALGARAETFSGLCGFGDLLATCGSPHSRNRRLGELLGRGLSLAEATAQSPQVAEGVPTTRTAVRLADRLGVELPILTELEHILFDEVPLREALAHLMARPIGHEFG